ncbi:MAG: response regulator [Vicingaceae bacterium]
MKAAKKVLIAEDDLLLGIIWQESLMEYGLDVTVAQNGRLAIELLQSINYDLIITDIDLPLVCGKEVIHLLHEVNASTPVVVCSGSISCEQELKDYQIDLFLEKPLDITKKSAQLIKQFLQ